MNWDDLRVFLEVARAERLSEAARRLGMDASTVSRRIHRLEAVLSSQLFERSADGHSLTAEGSRLLQSATLMATQADTALATVKGHNLDASGNVRIGATEGFGSFFIAPNLADFHAAHTQITVDLLPLPRFPRLTRHEVDIAVTVERPRHTSFILAKLCDYRLRVYGGCDYLARRPVSDRETLYQHDWVGYMEDMIFSDQLSYLDDIVPNANVILRSSSVIAQWQAVRCNIGLGILPCFLADDDPALRSVFPADLVVSRTFWLAAHPDYKRMARVEKVWNFLKQAVSARRDQLLGQRPR